MDAISASGLCVRYGKRTILDDVSLAVRKGQIFGFIGPNGAGKSTFIKTLVGLVFPASGRILLNGEPPHAGGGRQSIGFLPEEANYYKFLTPVESLHFYGDVCGVPRKVLSSRVNELLSAVGLYEVRDKRVGSFSKGMAQKLGLAQALINDPEILILDEPTSGLDPLARTDLRTLLVDLKSRGKTVFFSSHELSEVELICDAIAVIRAGKVLVCGPMKEALGGTEQNLEKLFIRLIKGGSA